MVDQKPCILVADDEHAITALVSDMLTHAGFRVVRAHGGAEALMLGRAERPELMLLDVMMPDLDGRDACRVVKMDLELQHIRVVLFSSADEDEIHWREAGADAFLQKPFIIRALPDFIRDILDR